MVMLVEQGHDLSCAEMLGNTAEHLNILHRFLHPAPGQFLYQLVPVSLARLAIVGIKCDDTRPLVTMQ